jgi:exonuclease III
VIKQPLTSVDPDMPNVHRDVPASDHAPVIATFANL